jgi:dolichol-phosphate mannosyltransferase
VVVPVYNEAETIGALLDEIQTALAAFGDAEVVLVDDGSDDDTSRVIDARRREAGAGALPVRLLHHGRRSGQSAAVHTGARAARGTWIATLDGDGQNDPADIPRLWQALEQAGLPQPALVGGMRLKRRDTWSKRLASRFANGLRQSLLRDGATDTGCGIKLFRREAFLGLPFFGAQHRFLPALFRIHGHRTLFVAVHHRPRLGGRSKYGNLKRALVGVVDLLGVAWLKARTPPPPPVRED